MLRVLLALILASVATPVEAPMHFTRPILMIERVDPQMELLASLILAEAEGECFDGKVAVGAVVVNRVNDSRWPDTVEDVINDPRQFCPVSRGLPTATDRTREAAKAALAGEDPTGGAVFFYNPQTARCGWIRSRYVLATIGSHVFTE